MPFPASNDIPYVYKPNIKEQNGSGFAVFNTDSLGLRSIEPGVKYASKANNEYRIAIVGDSVTFGVGVKQTEDTFCQVMENILNQKQDQTRFRVFNFAVSGYSVKEMTASLRHRMLDIDPDIVILASIPADLNLSRTPVIDKWGYFYNKKKSGLVSKNNVIKYLLRKMRIMYLLRDLNYQWKQRKKANPSQIDTKSQHIPESYKYFKDFIDVAHEHNVEALVVLLPTSVDSFGEVPNQLHQDHIRHVDLSDIRQEFTMQQYKASKFDNHASFLVHRRIGERLAEYLLTTGYTKRGDCDGLLLAPEVVR